MECWNVGTMAKIRIREDALSLFLEIRYSIIPLFQYPNPNEFE